MKEMTSHERFGRMFEHRPADRVPVVDGPWSSTIERWQREGMPKDVSYVDFFGLDQTAGLGADNSPRFPVKTLEETEQYTVFTSAWGATMKCWKHAGGTPEFLDFIIKDPESWKMAKARMTPTRDRVDWEHLRKNYPAWRQKDLWITAGLWFGFDVTHSWTVGTERLLMALVEQPEWCADMFNHFLEVHLALLDMIWDEGYRFDCVSWPDDLGYKNHQFLSLKMYRELVKPAQKRACDWARAKGVYTELHSCGDVNPLVPDFLEIGIDALNPLEVKAGMDPTALKKKFGDRLVFHGGINAVLWPDLEAIQAEIARVMPVMKQSGGYVFSSDHSVPDSVSLTNFRQIVELAKKAGSYE